tara:strand:- start:1126 stop:2682 length:1557 start_codon:yes stop_codon:yes gene_type:complete
VLKFSKINILVTFVLSILVIFFSISNVTKFDDNYFNKKINLGLDLQGGSYLLLKIDNDPVVIKELQNKAVSLKNFFKENKIQIFNINVSDDKEIIFSTNKKNIDEVESRLNDKDGSINIYFDQFKSFQYEVENEKENFKLKLSKYGLIKIKTSSLDQAIEIVRRRVDEVGTNEPNILKRGNDRILVELPGLDDPMRIKNLLGKTANLTFRFVTKSSDETFGSEQLEFEDGSEIVNVSKRIVVSGENLVDAQPRMDNQTNETVVTFDFDRVGAKRFGRATTKAVGKRLAIVLDGKVISAPVIQEAIVAGSGQISGDFTFQSATDLALLLRSGALPAPLEIIEERTVGPGLGEDSIKSGLLALLIGFVLVIAFMLFKYKVFGIIANTTLILNLFFLVGILTIFEATLTLPGIAGIILTVGMAVDANVLIFERIKEEIRNEKNQIIAFDSGYIKSRSAVLDANITTLIAAVILFFLGSGPIKGFAVTLGTGIFTTLFSVYFIARLLTSIYVIKNKNKENLI